jgi:CHASE2 domain-containing sensor protein
VTQQENGAPAHPEPITSDGDPRPGILRRSLRAVPVVATLVLLTWIFGHSGVLHKVERVVSDAQLRLNRAPTDSPVAVVDIDDEDYREIFGSTSPLDPRQLQKLVSAIAKGQPNVIGIDIDTSDARFATQFTPPISGPQLVWERELRDAPPEGTEGEQLQPLDILGGQKNINPATNSSGLPLLIDDSETKVTRKYRRSISTQRGSLPSFPSAIAKAYLRNDSERLAKLADSQRELLIRYSGNPEGSHRLHFSARKTIELSNNWPATTPIRNKIVLLGGSYLGQDRHETPIGQLTGLEMMANVVETELAGGGEEPPSSAVLLLLELFEAFVLILLFHALRFRFALLWSILIIPVMAIVCSFLAYRNGSHFVQFVFVLLGLLIFEVYEHFRRSTVPKVYHDIKGVSHS